MEDIDFRNWRCDVKKDSIPAKSLCERIQDGYDRKHGGIVLNPVYQREYKFNRKKESSIIESLILGIPLPVIYLSKDIEQEVVLLNVIDGMHRLYSIYRYINNKYRLTGLSVLKGLDGLTFDQLPTNIKNRLYLDSQINIESIDISNNKELEYQVFLRFNQETNPLTKQELNEVLYRSDFSYWFKDVLMKKLINKVSFKKLFKVNETRVKNKTLNYDVYVCLGYTYCGLVEGKNDTPYYVERFMKKMASLSPEGTEEYKIKMEEYLDGFIKFYFKISEIEEIEYIFSKQFMTKELPSGNHNFLISFIIPLSLAYNYLLYKGFFDNELSEEDYSIAYNAIVKGMKKESFNDFGGVSSTSHSFQKKCFESIKNEIDKLMLLY